MKTANEIFTICTMLQHGCSFSEIRQSCGVGNSTITRVKDMMIKNMIDMDRLNKSDLKKLFEMTYEKSDVPSPARPLPDFEKVYENTHAKKGRTTLQMEWEEYKKQYPDGYQYTQFKVHYRRWEQENRVPPGLKMVLEREPGKELFMDWAGDVLPLVLDPKDPGKLLNVHLFVTTIGVSSKIYVKGTPNEKTPAVIAGVNGALSAYGAMPKVFVPDNMRTAVNRHTKDELVLSQAFQDMQRFYDVPVVPAPPLKPKGKASVENAVKWVSQRVLGKLRGQTFVSFDQLNDRIEKIVQELNSRVQARTGKSRNQIFEEVDRPAMDELPVQLFQYEEYALCTVPDTYHIKFDEYYYSVPYRLFNKADPVQVMVKARGNEIDIYDDGNRLICTHARSSKQRYTTMKEHMPPAHKYAAEGQGRDADYYLSWASDVGPDMASFIELLMMKSRFPQQSFNACNAILHSAKALSYAAANEAAAECLEINEITMSGIKRKMDARRKRARKAGSTVPQHGNVRGKDYYR